MYNLLVRQVMAPSLDILRGTQAMQCWKELEASQWWPGDKILELQNQRLRRLVKYAYDHVPYYHQSFDDAGVAPGDINTGEDLKKLPILNKGEIRNNFDGLTARGFPPGQRIKLHTSGSTGQQLDFYTSRYQHISLAFAERQRGYASIGFEIGEKFVQLNFRNQQRAGPVKIQRVIDALKREMVINIRDMIDNKMERVAEKLHHYKPKFIRGFPSIVYELARFIRNNRRYDLRPVGIITGGEQLFDFQRSYFREVFGCDTYDFYGTEEQHTIAVECPLHNSYHLVAENVIVEIIDNNGKSVPPGIEGEIAITNLHNYTMPLIRYRIGDIGVMMDRVCPCGRGLPLLGSLSGRIYDVIITKSERVIPGQYLMGPLRTLYADLNMQEFQIVQEKYGKILVKFIPGENSQTLDYISSAIIDGYQRILGDEIDVSVEAVEKIERSQAGKLRKVMNNVRLQ